jgi:hypothetical protein
MTHTLTARTFALLQLRVMQMSQPPQLGGMADTISVILAGTGAPNTQLHGGRNLHRQKHESFGRRESFA